MNTDLELNRGQNNVGSGASFSNGYSRTSNRGGRQSPATEGKPAANVLVDLLGTFNVIGKTQSYSIGNNPEIVLATNPKRVGFAVQNLGANPVYVSFGSAPLNNNGTITGGIMILSGGYFSYENIFCPTNDIYLMGISTGTNVTINELVKV
jgi:hypothetical protein